ncbi:Uncharacterised protein [Serratia entomophila]|nr:Uncharacterised protein [Serratia entomophila]CAI0924763.1 Uncharacterised protein [Serratia entomophila]CAI0937056.1 Uncharacterised protein [Serratia entomophila]CAI1719461.1 Uncharacterised protein [Serratia entomophila]
MTTQSLSVDTYQLILFNQEVNRIGESDTGINMFLNNLLISKRRVV